MVEEFNLSEKIIDVEEIHKTPQLQNAGFIRDAWVKEFIKRLKEIFGMAEGDDEEWSARAIKFEIDKLAGDKLTQGINQDATSGDKLE